jgi:hypothetical protein
MAIYPIFSNFTDSATQPLNCEQINHYYMLNMRRSSQTLGKSRSKKLKRVSLLLYETARLLCNSLEPFLIHYFRLVRQQYHTAADTGGHTDATRRATEQ